ncbi:MAG TPA: hypothetical protein VF607_00465 [Verrucomicrobiae bacterium]
MNQAWNIASAPVLEAAPPAVKLLPFTTHTVCTTIVAETDLAAIAESIHENDRRATEIGPVLQKMLDEQWRHWGLND